MSRESFFIKEEGDIATVVCNPGYYSNQYKETFQVVCSEKGVWLMPDGSLPHQCNSMISTSYILLLIDVIFAPILTCTLNISCVCLYCTLSSSIVIFNCLV